MPHPDAPGDRGGADAGRRALLLGLPALLLAGCSKAVGATLPEVELAGLPGLLTADGRPVPGLVRDAFRRGPALLNIWASWCPDCRAEHGQLMRLARDNGLRLLGLVFRDKPEAAAAYLRRAGNPFEAVALDDGGIARLLGQKGVPYSYVVSGRGRVLAMVAGSLDDRAVAETIMPAVRSAQGEDRATG